MKYYIDRGFGGRVMDEQEMYDYYLTEYLYAEPKNNEGIRVNFERYVTQCISEGWLAERTISDAEVEYISNKIIILAKELEDDEYMVFSKLHLEKIAGHELSFYDMELIEDNIELTGGFLTVIDSEGLEIQKEI